MEIENKIVDCIQENGIDVLENGVLSVSDSISYISAIVALEDVFSIEFPDEYLTQDLFTDIESLSYMIRLLIEIQNKQNM